MPETIEHKFNPEEDLPCWAQLHKSVEEFARIDLAYRCALWDAKTPSQRHLLIEEAKRVMRGE